MDAFNRISLIGSIVLLMCLLLAYGIKNTGVNADRYALKAEVNDGLSGAKRTAMCTARRFIF
ncbi:hypothetical protein QWY82_18355 [Simiduia curdlanivorans]|uniref:Uncharacterized protein n=1 Tax=Simiduia curdlanivorans TaxID=1492769 RepID=A0ABV8V7A7_9GAMM|nr:hypothetical protein [Simiduia curdlanivorans]MDN3640767.1 hypothetical protein [Simiduia curdlanivorans]